MPRIFALLLIGLSCCATASWGYFQDAGFGVRPAGMGEAFVSVADDANCVLYNPAGYARIRDFELTGMYADLHSNINALLYTGNTDRLAYQFLSLAIPFSPATGTFGVAWNHFDSVFYKENTFSLSYGREVLPLGGLDVGCNLKVLQWLVTPNAYSSNPLTYPYADLQKTGFTADVGVLSIPLEGFTLGGSVENLIPANLGLAGEHRVPLVMRAGVSFRHHWEKHPVDSLLAQVEWSDRDGEANVKLGLESWFFANALAVRAGVNYDATTAGLGFRYQPPDSRVSLQLDYAFTYPFQVFDSLGSHRMGLTLRWKTGGKWAETLETDQIEFYYQRALETFYLGELRSSLGWWEKILALEPDNEVAQTQAEELQQRLRTPSAARTLPKVLAVPGRTASLRVVSRLAPAGQALNVRLTGVTSLAPPAKAQPEYADDLGSQMALAAKYERQGDNRQAQEALEIALALAPNQPEAVAALRQLRAKMRVPIEQAFRRGMKAFKDKDYLPALWQFQLVLKISPEHALAGFYLKKTRDILAGRIEKNYQEGEALLRRGQYQQAAEYFKLVMEFAPTYRNAAGLLQKALLKSRLLTRTGAGYASALKAFTQTQLDKALAILSPFVKQGVGDSRFRQLFSRAIRQKSLSLKFYHQGVAHYQVRRLNDSIASFRRSLDLDRGSRAKKLLVEAYLNLGVLAYRRDDFKTAQSYWEQILTVQPDHAMGLKNLRRTKHKIEFLKKNLGDR